MILKHNLICSYFTQIFILLTTENTLRSIQAILNVSAYEMFLDWPLQFSWFCFYVCARQELRSCSYLLLTDVNQGYLSWNQRHCSSLSELDFQILNLTVKFWEIISNVPLGEDSRDTVFEWNLKLLNAYYYCIFCFAVRLVGKV